MADEADLANDQLDSELSRAINRIRKSASTGANTGIGTKTCIECGEDIPDARRELGFQFCIVCAETRERHQALFVGD